MTTFNENIDPRSLPNLPNLLTHSAHKRNNKLTLKVPLTSPRLKESVQNVKPHPHRMLESGAGLQFPTPIPLSQSVVVSEDKTMEETRLPISPPPEEEIRIKELSNGITPKEPNSRLLARSRAGAFKVPALPQSSVHSRQQVHEPASRFESQQSDGTLAITPSASTASKSNPRKRSRSTLPLRPIQDDTILMSTDPISSAQSSIIIPSPNPRVRKQLRQHDVGVYSGSGLKRRHKCGTSAESLDIVDDGQILSPGSTNFKSPARKKRRDPGIMDYTPEREQASTSTSKRSLKKPKRRATRSSTPEVRYEPPTEQFTPPREVVLEIPSSTVSSRSRNTKRSVSTGIESRVDRKVIRVKSERLTSPFPLPPIDFSKPAPPPSPTDDPLLLVGPPVIVRRSATPAIVPTRTLVDASVGVDKGLCQDGPSTPVRASPTATREVDQSVWNFGPDLEQETALMGVAFDGPSTFDATFESEDSDADAGINHGAVHLHPNFESAPVRFDPDQSTSSSAFHSDDEDAEIGEGEGEYTGRFLFYSVPVKQDPPSSATKARRESWGRPISPYPFTRRMSRPPSLETISNRPVLLDEDSPPPSPSMGRRRTALPAQELHTHISPLSPAFSVSPGAPAVSSPLLPKQLVDHCVALDDESSDNTPEFEAAYKDDNSLHATNLVSPTRNERSSDYHDKHITPAPDDGDSLYTQEFKGSHEDDDGIYGKHITSPGVVEVSSEDPKAAARAAAILKLHHSYVVDGDVSHCSRQPSPSDFSSRPPYISRAKSIGDTNINIGHVWAKTHWKMLDMCFTDERLAVSSAMGLDGQLADVDDVEMSSVVERFLAQIDEVDWDYDMLLRRATALKGRQRAGQGAPPSPGGLVLQNTVPEFVVPLLTPPIGSRALNLATEAEISNKLPPSLLAPRYAHLHEELTTNPSTPPDLPTLSRSSISEQDRHAGNDLDEEKDAHDHQATPPKRDESSHHPATPAVQPDGSVPVPSSTAKRLLSYVGSLMSRSSAVTSSKPPLRPQFKALPLPPPEMQQVTRGPISTPVKKPIPKIQPPRELVNLSETQLPAKPLQFPKAKSAKEMVHLNHVEPPRSVQRPRTVSGPIVIPGRSRKDSGGSVKDLVKSFEAVRMKTEDEVKRTNSRLGLRKVTSVGNFSARPIWKP